MASTAKTRNEAKITLRIPYLVAPLSINEAICEEQLCLYPFHLNLHLNQYGLIRNKAVRI